MDHDLPGIVVTGASGFVGRHFLAAAQGRYRLFCLARRSQAEAGIPDFPNLRWTQVDVARWDTMRQVVRQVKENGGADFVLHLAGYYDFQFMEHPEYERTNVHGTRNVLKLATQLGVKRFLFASSLAACRFPPAGRSVNEDSAPDAAFAYARSKSKGEELVREHTEWFPGSIVRLAAVYSDWCEYPPLYVFLSTWLGKRWNSRILGGRGDSAVTYIHVQDLVKLLLRIMERSDDLPRLAVYNASPNRCTSHRELFQIATRWFFGEQVKPVCVPRWLAVPGVRLRWWGGRLCGRLPFEAPWMTQYIDRQLNVDATRTQAALDWQPARRFELGRRLLPMIENMKSHREVWVQRNEAALRRVARRPNLMIAEAMQDMREAMLAGLEEMVYSPANRGRFPDYRELDRQTMRWYLTLVYQVLIAAVHTRDRQLVRHYAQVIAARRRQQGFPAQEVQDLLSAVSLAVADALRGRPELQGMAQHIHDNIVLNVQLAVDGVEDVYEVLEIPPAEADADRREGEGGAGTGDLDLMLHQLAQIADDTFPAMLRSGPEPVAEVRRRQP